MKVNKSQEGISKILTSSLSMVDIKYLFVIFTRMKLFQEYLKVVSIFIVRDEAFADNTVNRLKHFFLKTLPPFLFLTIYMIFASVFLFFKTESFQQICEIFYPWVTSALNMCGLGSIIFGRDRIFIMVNHIEYAVNSREFFGKLTKILNIVPS